MTQCNIDRGDFMKAQHRQEMIRLSNLYLDGYISRERAMELFQRYLEENLGRRAFREYPYKAS